MMGVAAMSAMAMAQSVTTHSVYDVNQNGEINVADVVSVAQATLQEVNPEQTQQYVTGEDLSILLNNVLQELSDIKKRLNYVMKESGMSNPFEPDENGIITNGHKYVDLGVVVDGKPVYWATTNIGADYPADYGLYFAWGETVGYGSSPQGVYDGIWCVQILDGRKFDWASYSSDLCDGAYDKMKKYCTDSSYGTVDNNTVLDPEDDAAYVNWQGTWRMPTTEELDALCNQCSWTWTTMANSAGENVNGYKVSSKTDSSKFIFLPAAGYRGHGGLYLGGSSGYYWSNSLYPSINYGGAYNFYLSSTERRTGPDNRCSGLSIRPVCQ